jgi:antitoxin MazE
MGHASTCCADREFTGGVRIPKPLIEQAGLRDEVEIAVEGSSLIIRAAARPRTGWASAFRAMAERGDDRQVEDAGGSTTRPT